MPSRPNGFDSPIEDGLLKQFPPLYDVPFPTCRDPITITDSEGLILAWYLPNSLTPERQVKRSQIKTPYC